MQTKLTSTHVTSIEGQHQTKNMRKTWVFIHKRGDWLTRHTVLGTIRS